MRLKQYLWHLQNPPKPEKLLDWGEPEDVEEPADLDDELETGEWD